MKPRLAWALLLAAAPAWAQNEQPAVSDDLPAVQTDFPEPSAAPALPPADTPIEPTAAPQTLPGAGTTVVGERETPIGLYIMPWRQSEVQGGLDRPARLLDEELRPLDPEVFRRQVEYHRALTEHLQKTGRATP